MANHSRRFDRWASSTTWGWWAPLLGLAAVRVAIPVVALAASGRDVPTVPPYTYTPLNGDSFGFYAATREFLATFGRIHSLLLVAVFLFLVGGSWWGYRLYRRRSSWQGIVLVAAVLSLALAFVIERMALSGAAVFGWSLVWAMPMLPYRAVGLPLDPDIAFGFGFALSLAANAVSVVATGFIGLHASGRRAVGLTAAGLFTVWPMLTRPLAGTSAWENGQWQADVGLHLYTEPLSTALIAVALALLLSPGLDDVRLALAGLVLGYATFTKLSNGYLAITTVLIAAVWLGPRRVIPLAAGGLAIVPLVGVYWPKGYPAIEYVPGWSAEYVARNWTDSLIFEPRALLVLLVPALAGALLLRRTLALALLGAVIVITAAVYSFYEVTWLHPRFLYVALPSLFVFQAVAAVELASRASARS